MAVGVVDDDRADAMRPRGFVVRQARTPSSGAESWTVVGRDGRPVELVDEFLGWLTGIERSPNTVYGQIKYNRHIDRFMPRGRAAAQSEWRLVAATHNLLKLHTHWIANTA